MSEERSKLTEAEVAERQRKRKEWDESARLDGMELQDHQKELLEQFDKEGLTDEQCIERVKKMYSDK